MCLLYDGYEFTGRCLVYELVGLIATHFADSVLKHHILLEEVVYRHFVLCIVVHGALEEEAQEALCAIAAGACGEVAEEHEVKAEGSCENRVATEEVNLNLHGIAHPAEDIDVVPAFLVIVARRIVVDAHLVVVVGVEVGLLFGHEDRLESRELRHFFGAEVGGFVEHETVAVAEDIGREPAGKAEATGADDRSEARLNESLACLEVLAGLVFSASSHMAGKSTVVLGAPMMKGAPSVRAA